MRKLDEALEECFPASDAPADTPETGIRIVGWPAISAAHIADNAAKSRFELSLDGATAFLAYEPPVASVSPWLTTSRRRR